MTGFDRTRNQNIALVWPVQNYLWFTLQFNIIWNLNKQKKKKKTWQQSVARKLRRQRLTRTSPFLIPTRLGNHVENCKKWHLCPGTLCITVSPVYKYQHEESVVGPEVWKLQFMLNGKRKKTIYRFAFNTFRTQKLLCRAPDPFMQQRTIESVQGKKKIPIGYAIYSCPSPLVGFWIYICF